MTHPTPQTPATETKTKPTVDLPTPAEFYRFLTKEVGIDCLDPDEPARFWPEFVCQEKPFTNELVREIRGFIREKLRVSECSPADLPPKRLELLKGKPVGQLPTSSALLLAAGAYAFPGQRLQVCLDLIGVSQKNADSAAGGSSQQTISNFITHNESYAHLRPLCSLLDLPQAWIEHGPAAFDGARQARICPPWLEPWWLLSEMVDDFFDIALRNSCLHYISPGDPSKGFDFGSFWIAWKNRAKHFTPDFIRTRICNYKLLPWLFFGRAVYLAGDPPTPVTFTRRTWRILNRLIDYGYFVQAGRAPDDGDAGAALHQASASISVRCPSMDELLDLKTRVNFSQGQPTFGNRPLVGTQPARQIEAGNLDPSRKKRGRPGKGSKG